MERNFGYRRSSVVKEGRRFLAEVIGALILTFVTALSKIEYHTKADVNSQITALSGAGVVTALIFALAHVSGAHFNPVITLGFFLRGVLRWWRLFTYILAQFIGATLAGALLYWHFGHTMFLGGTVPRVTDGVAFGLETLFTAILVLVILNVADKHKLIGTNAAIAVGAVVAAMAIIGGPLTGASMNPMRSIGVAMFAGRLNGKKLWIYIIAPVVGSLIAVALSYLLGPVRTTRTDRIERRGTGGIGVGSSPGITIVESDRPPLSVSSV